MMQIDMTQFQEKSLKLLAGFSSIRSFIEKNLFAKDEALPPFIYLRITPREIRYQLVNNHFIEQEETFAVQDVEKLVLALEHYTQWPLYIVLSQWELSSKVLDLNNTTPWDRYFIQKTFKACEFKEKDLIQCSLSSLKEGVYRYIGVSSHYILDHIFANLTLVKNGVIDVQLEEQILVDYVVDHLSPPLHDRSWRLIFVKQDGNAQILVMNERDIVLSRVVDEKQVQNLAFLLETVRYLPRLGKTSQNPITLYAQKDIFSRIDLSDHQIDLIEFYHIEENLFQQVPYPTIVDHFKKALRFDFVSQSLKIPGFFWQKFFYHLPRFGLFILTPSVLLASVMCILLGIQVSYYQTMMHTATHQPIDKTLIEQAIEHDRMMTFKAYYQENPIVLFKKIAQKLGQDSFVTELSFKQDHDKISMVMRIENDGDPVQKNKTKDQLLSVFQKQHPEFEITQKFHGKNGLQLEWKQK